MRNHHPGRRLLSAVILLLAGISLPRAGYAAAPGTDTPRQRLGKLLAATFFDVKGCEPILYQYSLNIQSELPYVNEVGTHLDIILGAIRDDDAVAIARYSTDFDDHGLLVESERETLLALSAIAEVIVSSRRVAGRSEKHLDFGRLRRGAKVFARWTDGGSPSAALDRAIARMERPIHSGGAGGGSGPPVGNASDSPSPDGPGGGAGRVASSRDQGDRIDSILFDAFRIAGSRFIALLRTLVDDDDSSKRGARPFREDFCTLLQKELGRSPKQGECDTAWRAWHSGATLKQIARESGSGKGH